jgi:hypothetical protein
MHGDVICNEIHRNNATTQSAQEFMCITIHSNHGTASEAKEVSITYM